MERNQVSIEQIRFGVPAHGPEVIHHILEMGFIVSGKWITVGCTGTTHYSHAKGVGDQSIHPGIVIVGFIEIPAIVTGGPVKPKVRQESLGQIKARQSPLRM